MLYRPLLAVCASATCAMHASVGLPPRQRPQPPPSVTRPGAPCGHHNPDESTEVRGVQAATSVECAAHDNHTRPALMPQHGAGTYHRRMNARGAACMHAGLYALICATASLTGVFRSAISLVVLVVEGTQGINFLFGVIIAVVVANFVGSALGQDGVYESEIERDGNVFFLPSEPRRILSTLTAEQVRQLLGSVTPWVMCLKYRGVEHA